MHSSFLCSLRRGTALLALLWLSSTNAQLPSPNRVTGQAMAEPSTPVTGFAAYKRYAFPTELTSSAGTGRLAFALDQAGQRNVFVAEAPGYQPRQLTSFTQDDGQEISSLQISADGQWVVFVRGGEHSANWESGQAVNPTQAIQGQKVQVHAIPFSGGKLLNLAEADDPLLSPDGQWVVFLKGGQVFAVPTDASAGAKPLFVTKGNVGSLVFSPNGKQLAFVANRQDHALVGVFDWTEKTLRWLAPSFHRDQSPRWSPDGQYLAFVRTPGTGGAPEPLLPRKHNPWSIWVVSLSTGKAEKKWESPKTLAGSYPTTHGGTNLFWCQPRHIQFMGYHDGWPHLYQLDLEKNNTVCLTPGPFMVEHVKASPDKNFLYFSTNHQEKDSLDLDRRHVGRVNLLQPQGVERMTRGKGLEWMPVATGDGQTLAFFAATHQSPPSLATLALSTLSAPWKNAGESLQEKGLPTDFVVPQKITFKAADGLTVHADWFVAKGPGRKPALVYVHGGPPRQMLLGWHYSDYYSNAYAANQYLVALGFNVLVVNYRLGIGYGEAFHRPEGGGALGAKEYQDIQAAGKWLLQNNATDPQRIGIYGGSYGGYLTAMALARDSKIFAAGVDIHGVHDQTLSNALAAAGEKWERAPDYEKARQVAWLSSPIAYTKTWTSPVLLIHGDDDRNVRVSQTTDLVRRLEQQKIPHETLLVPDDTHHWMRHSNAVMVYQAVADFFVRQFLK